MRRESGPPSDGEGRHDLAAAKPLDHPEATAGGRQSTVDARLGRYVSRGTVPVALVDPDPDQPRQRFDLDDLAELAASMQTNGLAVPVLVRPVAGRYRLVHGERRWRAATSLGWSEIPAEVRDIDDETARWLQLAENVNRADLSPIEEARAFRGILADGVSRDTLAGRIGKSTSYIAQKLRLLDLPAPLALLLDAGSLSEGHVRQLLRIRRLYTDSHTVAAICGDPTSDLGPLWADLTSEKARDNVAWLLLNSFRPEDWPPRWPFDLTGHPVVADAVEALCHEAADGACPYWTLPATWFAAVTVVATLSVAELDKYIDRWLERLHAAIFYAARTGRMSRDDTEPGTLADREKWGYRSDLRHAGLTDHEHLRLAALEAIGEAGWYAGPSSCQPWGPHHEEYGRLAVAAAEERSW